jgi:IMP dehydrogenase
MQVRESYSFDDLLLVPQHGVLDSRKDADISSELVEDWPLLVPIISANMPSVTESAMAIAMWSIGAGAVIHRFNTIAEQIELVRNSRGTGFCVAIGLKDGFDRTYALADIGSKVFCLDVAHADTDKVFDFIREWRHLFPDR